MVDIALGLCCYQNMNSSSYLLVEANRNENKSASFDLMCVTKTVRMNNL